MLNTEVGYQRRDFAVMNWVEKKVIVLGAARQGIAIARYLARHGAEVTLNDRRTLDEFQAAREELERFAVSQAAKPVNWVCGGHPLELLDSADLLCISGGVPLELPIVVEALRREIPVTNDSQIFLEAAPCRTIGITGSAGKTTTTTLVGRIAEAALRQEPMTAGFGRVWVGGNIGTPLITVVDEMAPTDLAILELSSFQLEIMTRSPNIAAVLNITPNHMDRHRTMQAYIGAKTRILTYQTRQDTAILNRDDAGAWELADQVQGELVAFGVNPASGRKSAFLRESGVYLRGDDRESFVLARAQIRLRGEHNLLNVLAACAIAMAAGIPVEAMRAGVEGFSGVPHRLEYVRTWGGADWFNDSIATAPERSMAAIRSFDESLVLLAGGRDKDLPWEDFARLACQRVGHLILFGEAAGKIEEAIQRACPAASHTKLMRRSNLEEAVLAAAGVVQPGDVVLLSPGGTSFDEFRDFEERGECFKRLVKLL